MVLSGPDTERIRDLLDRFDLCIPDHCGEFVQFDRYNLTLEVLPLQKVQRSVFWSHAYLTVR